MKDKKLCNRLRRGDIEALNELIDIYTGYLKAIVRNIIGSALQEQDVEEIVADSFVALWYSRSKIENGKLKSYIASIARNKAKSRLRDMHITEPLDDDYIAAECSEPENLTLRNELQEITRDVVESLPEPDCEIFKRHYFLYQKTEDISKAMGINSATVRTKLKRGRDKLKIRLAERGVANEIFYN